MARIEVGDYIMVHDNPGIRDVWRGATGVVVNVDSPYHINVVPDEDPNGFTDGRSYCISRNNVDVIERQVYEQNEEIADFIEAF